MIEDDQVFLKQLGQRIAGLRKELCITQVQLAEYLGISQQYMQAFEVGRRKVSVSMLPKLSTLFGISVDTLVGMEDKPTKRGPAPKLLRQVEQIRQLPRSEQKLVSEMLDAIIQKNKSKRWNRAS
ncbi:helix-turn-helix transcriptional regulator [uncultured Microbulbifer sp.]|uniref:helix-turn-helix domain-containing protein n=1 Tax=uncultured Microbulbifer sp. TaxID=348147 RepID=UPI00262B0FFA|nr:helix-turn-helix transcriptional regulator [uncultured Microbulbifer sp.]